jgi:hypothetical protein
MFGSVRRRVLRANAEGSGDEKARGDDRSAIHRAAIIRE